MSFKLDAIDYVQRVSHNTAAKKYKVDLKRFCKWCKNKQLISELKKVQRPGKKKLDRGGSGYVTDDIILEWIYRRNTNELRVSHELILAKAEHLYNERCPEGEQYIFKAIEGWF